MVRWLVALSAACGIAGCAVTALDVGSDQHATIAEDGGAPDADAEAGARLLERLTTLCAAQAGTSDYPASAAALTSRLAGRWYYCPSLGNWADPPQGIEFDFTSSGVWAFLGISDAGTDFVASTDPDETGGVLYLVPRGVPGDAGPEGGEGGTPDGGTVQVTVPIDDTTPLNDFQLELVRATANDFFFSPSFEKGPRRMVLHELGNDPATGVFVPIE